MDTGRAWPTWDKEEEGTHSLRMDTISGGRKGSRADRTVGTTGKKVEAMKPETTVEEE